MTDLQKFKEKTIKKFSSTITDSVFLMIQNDKELMKEYLLLLEKHKLNILNSSLAKEIKKRYNLENKDLKNISPKSNLIQTFEVFEVD